MRELILAGICEVMPSLGAADDLSLVFRLASQGHKDEVYEAFRAVLPQIVFSLQNFELLHHVENSQLAARGIIPEAVVREASLDVNDHDRQHIHFLNGKVLDALDRFAYLVTRLQSPG